MTDTQISTLFANTAAFLIGASFAGTLVFGVMFWLQSKHNLIFQERIGMRDDTVVDLQKKNEEESKKCSQYEKENNQLKNINAILTKKTSCLMCPTCGGSVQHVDTKKYDNQDYHHASTYIFKCETCDTPILMDANQFSELFREISKNIKHIQLS